MTSTLKKAELHLHLEAGAPISLVLSQAAKYGADMSPFIRDGAYVWRDFTTFIHCYDAAAALFKSEEDFALLAETYLTEIAAAGAVYGELFVSPDHGVSAGLSARAYIAGISEGMKRAKEKTGIESRMVIIGVRHLGADACEAASMPPSGRHRFIPSTWLQDRRARNVRPESPRSGADEIHHRPRLRGDFVRYVSMPRGRKILFRLEECRRRV